MLPELGSANHKFEGIYPYTKCSKCSATVDQAEAGISCGLVRCRECTLLRPCYSGVCEECRTNMIEAARKRYYNMLADNIAMSNCLLNESSLENLCIEIRNAGLKISLLPKSFTVKNGD